MNILMVTNTYLPHVGGVARSVESFTVEFRRQGHRVVVVAPKFKGVNGSETDIIRIPAIQNFNSSDFSFTVTVPGSIMKKIIAFRPDVVHSHHPFLMGDAALRIATASNAPLFFTHHTMYEYYTHYVPGDSPTIKRFVQALATSYANLCDCVIAPTKGVSEILRSRGVQTPVEVIPTGIEIAKFRRGNGCNIRMQCGIGEGVFVIGYVGRLAVEKNLIFLSVAVADFMKQQPNSHFLVVGAGPCRQTMDEIFNQAGLYRRVHFAGVCQEESLFDAYNAMDVFAFASKTETQGLVLVEAMAAGVPVVALRSPGASDVVIDKQNGRLVDREDIALFAESLRWAASLDAFGRRNLSEAARRTSNGFDLSECSRRLLKIYRSFSRTGVAEGAKHDNVWQHTKRMIEVEWRVWSARAEAGAQALKGTA